MDPLPVYPAGDLDDRRVLLDALGSFWSESYDGGDLVASLLYARGRLEAQAAHDLRALVACLGRRTIPTLHRETWAPLTLLESRRNQAVAALPRYDGTATYADGTTLRYGVPVAGALAYWPAPADLAEVAVIANRITDASRVLVCGIDFALAPGAIGFVADPFEDDYWPKSDVFSGNVVVDRTIEVWLYRAGHDRGLVHRQLGYVLGRPLPSTPAALAFCNAVMDALVGGTTARAVDGAIAALCDVPLAREAAETVLLTAVDTQARWVVTDRHAYRFAPDATPTVAAGATVARGDTLADPVLFYEFGRGRVPTPAQVPALALGRGLLAGGYMQDLVFENRDVPTIVTADPDGTTRLAFAIGGTPGDVARFWDTAQARGVAAGRTLAQLLDTRPAPAGQPAASDLPATINPLAFLLRNVLRDNLVLAVVRPGSFGPGAVGLRHAGLLRMVVPPHAALVILVELTAPPESITMDGPGDSARPGYEESARIYLGMAVAESIDPGVLISESVRVRQVAVRCE